MRWTEKFLVRDMRQRFFTKYTFETTFGIRRLHEKLFITIDVNSSKHKMRLNVRSTHNYNA